LRLSYVGRALSCHIVFVAALPAHLQAFYPGAHKYGTSMS
jgi:hypothetical protein